VLGNVDLASFAVGNSLTNADRLVLSALLPLLGGYWRLAVVEADPGYDETLVAWIVPLRKLGRDAAFLVWREDGEVRLSEFGALPEASWKPVTTVYESMQGASVALRNYMAMRRLN
jgi:hypothetical protein